MGKSRGLVPDNQRIIVQCTNCMRKFTKFMSIKLFHYKELYKCVSCYNGGKQNG
jgi:hypothetical protein